MNLIPRQCGELIGMLHSSGYPTASLVGWTFSISHCNTSFYNSLLRIAFCITKRIPMKTCASVVLGLLLMITGTNNVWAGDPPPVWYPEALSEADKGGYALTSPEEISQLYASGKELLILDVRPDYEYRAGHLPEAKNFEIHLGDRLQMKPDKKKAFREVLGQEKDRLVVIYCRSFR
jgi:hypothetical protein